MCPPKTVNKEEREHTYVQKFHEQYYNNCATRYSFPIRCNIPQS